MKLKIQPWKFSFVLILLGASFSLSAQHTGNTNEKTIVKEVKFNNNPKVNIQVYDLNVDIYPTKSDKIKAELIYVAEAKEKEDLLKLHEALTKGILPKGGDVIDINLRFYKNMVSIGGPGASKTTITLSNDSKIKLTNYNIISLKLYVPSELKLNLDAKYSNIQMHMNLVGNQHIKAYDSELELRSIQGNAQVKLDYSNLELENIQDANFTMYESHLSLKHAKNLEVGSKYGNIGIGRLNKVSYKGYEDKLEIQQLDAIKGDAKYTDMKFNQCKYINLTTYEGSIELEQSIKGTFNSKYTEIEIGNVDSLYALRNYECDYEIQSVNVLESSDGKYNEFDIEKFNHTLKENGYETELEINKVSPKFSLIDLKGKYLEADINMPSESSYYLKGDVNYSDFNFDKSDFRIIIDEKEGSKHSFKYLRGKQKDTPKLLLLNGYEIDLSLNH